MYTNIEAAKKLANTYRNLTEKDLKDEFDERYTNGLDVMHKITGFGSERTCTLCRSVDKYANGLPVCEDCVWYSLFPCNDTEYPCVQHETYQYIEFAGSPHELRQALLDRAEWLWEAIFKAEEENELENENTRE